MLKITGFMMNKGEPSGTVISLNDEFLISRDEGISIESYSFDDSIYCGYVAGADIVQYSGALAAHALADINERANLREKYLTQEIAIVLIQGGYIFIDLVLGTCEVIAYNALGLDTTKVRCDIQLELLEDYVDPYNSADNVELYEVLWTMLYGG